MITKIQDFNLATKWLIQKYWDRGKQNGGKRKDYMYIGKHV